MDNYNCFVSNSFYNVSFIHFCFFWSPFFCSVFRLCCKQLSCVNSSRIHLEIPEWFLHWKTLLKQTHNPFNQSLRTIHLSIFHYYVAHCYFSPNIARVNTQLLSWCTFVKLIVARTVHRSSFSELHKIKWVS